MVKDRSSLFPTFDRRGIEDKSSLLPILRGGWFMKTNNGTACLQGKLSMHCHIHTAPLPPQLSRLPSAEKSTAPSTDNLGFLLWTAGIIFGLYILWGGHSLLWEPSEVITKLLMYLGFVFVSSP
jgi:hypothetical protein